MIPGKICYNDKYWYAMWELESYLKLKSPTVKRLIRQGVLNARIIPKSGLEIFLLKENADVLPPKDVLGYVSMPMKDKKNTITIIPWYEIYNPKKVLGKYKIWPYLTAFVKNGKKS